MVYYKISNINIQQTRLWYDIAKLILSVPANEKNNKVLIIKIENISNHEGDSPLPKLEYLPPS